MVECTFRSNGAGRFVAVSSGLSSAPLTSGTGGAIRNDGKGPLILSQCMFLGNCAGSQGGALDNNKGDVTLTRCLFLQNDAGSSGGGAIWNSEGRIDLVSCILHGNRSDYSGGAIANGWSGTLCAVNCCLHANFSARPSRGARQLLRRQGHPVRTAPWPTNRQGGGPGAVVCGPGLDQTGSELTVANCILWNGGREIANLGQIACYGRREPTFRAAGRGPAISTLIPSSSCPTVPTASPGTEDDNLRLATGLALRRSRGHCPAAARFRRPRRRRQSQRIPADRSRRQSP